ncbi:YiiX/YebB-like N1pC/P60 family cysteine hydrolase [Pseudomonas syringae]|uniref:YiiX/YebB-like N1pC/P60 family cysteine hydrolase n=1 Tax=Pseudomonas syringae TaxID=317 RepID=UPI000F004EED|nr:YiiX/YebB-like N1pC/P60 family cysteine hydrolase [Pseudomonas azotoformans]
MSSVQLLFSTSPHPVSRLLRYATWSSWSHVALVNGDQVIEAVTSVGVRQVSLSSAICNASTYALVELPAKNSQKVHQVARSQIGKRYDWSAIVGLGLQRDWQEDDAWFCSELIAWAAATAGERWFRCEALHRVTPQHLWMLAPVAQQCSHVESIG